MFWEQVKRFPTNDRIKSFLGAVRVRMYISMLVNQRLPLVTPALHNKYLTF